MQRLALWLLALLIFTIPFENGATIPGVGSISRFIGVAAFGVGVMALFDRGRFNLRMPSLFVLLALTFALFGLASYFWSWEKAETFSSAITVLQLFVMVWLVWQFCRNEDDTAFLMQSFVLGCYAILAYAFVSFLGGGVDSYYRSVGGFNPNEFAIVTALGIPMAWYLALNRRNWRLAWLAYAYPALAVLGIILSASRGGLVTALVALAVIPLSLNRLSPRRQLLLFLLITATTWVGFVQAPKIYPGLSRNIERLSTTSQELTEGDLTGRTAIWANGIKVFLSAPLFGTGLGTFAPVVRPLLGEYKEAHNAFLSIAVGTGVSGLVIFAGMVAAAFASALLSSQAGRPFFLILFVALMVAMMPSNADSDKYAWFLLALLAAQRPVVLSTPSTGKSRVPSEVAGSGGAV